MFQVELDVSFASEVAAFALVVEVAVGFVGDLVVFFEFFDECALASYLVHPGLLLVLSGALTAFHTSCVALASFALLFLGVSCSAPALVVVVFFLDDAVVDEFADVSSCNGLFDFVEMVGVEFDVFL